MPFSFRGRTKSSETRPLLSTQSPQLRPPSRSAYHVGQWVSYHGSCKSQGLQMGKGYWISEMRWEDKSNKDKKSGWWYGLAERQFDEILTWAYEGRLRPARK